MGLAFFGFMSCCGWGAIHSVAACDPGLCFAENRLGTGWRAVVADGRGLPVEKFKT